VFIRNTEQLLPIVHGVMPSLHAVMTNLSPQQWLGLDANPVMNILFSLTEDPHATTGSRKGLIACFSGCTVILKTHLKMLLLV